MDLKVADCGCVSDNNRSREDRRRRGARHAVWRAEPLRKRCFEHTAAPTCAGAATDHF